MLSLQDAGGVGAGVGTAVVCGGGVGCGVGAGVGTSHAPHVKGQLTSIYPGLASHSPMSAQYAQFSLLSLQVPGVGVGGGGVGAAPVLQTMFTVLHLGKVYCNCLLSTTNVRGKSWSWSKFTAIMVKV